MNKNLTSVKKILVVLSFLMSGIAGVAQVSYPIPGNIQAENYSAMNDVKTESTTDVGGGLNVGFLHVNSWMDYNVNVAASGNYTFNFRLANAYSSGNFQIRTSDGTFLSSVDVPVTGDWQNWTTVSKTFHLDAGSQTLRLFVTSGGWNINWFNVNLQKAIISFNGLSAKRLGDDPFALTATSTNTQVPVTYASSDPSIVSVANINGTWTATINAAGTASITASQQGNTNFLAPDNVVESQVINTRNYSPLPGKVEAENFAAMNGVQTEPTSDDGGGYNVSYINDGDWMDYFVNVAASGYYTFSARVANPYYMGVLQIQNPNGNVLGTVTIPKTGGWQTWANYNATIYLNQGKQTLHLYVVKGQWNFNWFSVAGNTGIPQSIISFSPLANQTIGSGPFSLTATSNNTTTPITYSSSDPTVVSISNVNGSSMANIIGAGSATITASQAGNNQFSAAANVVQSITIAPVNVSSSTPPSNPGGYKSIPGKIEAESYNAMSGIQTENTADVGGGLDVSGINDNDWLDYNVNVASAGLYTFNWRIALAYGSSKIEIRATNGTVLGTANLSPTGGWQSWATVATTANLSAGNQTIRIYFVKGQLNFNWFQVVSGGQVPSVISFGDLPVKNLTDAPLNLTASSNNTDTPITFSSSDSTVVSVSFVNGAWRAILVAPGTANITASQAGDFTYLPANSVVKSQVVLQKSGSSALAKIPMTGTNWYQINTAGDNVTLTTGFQQLSDKVLDKPVFMGWAKFFANYDAYYEFKGQQDVTISKIRFFSGDKSFADKPFTLYAKETLSSQPVLIATFTGQQYMQWVEINLPFPVKAKYLKANIWWGLPNEMELYGSYNNAPITLYPKKEGKFRNQLGVNDGIWDLMQGAKDVSLRDSLDPTRLKLGKAFTQVRDYVEWEKIEPQPGVFTFQYTYSGGWNYDAFYIGLKENNIDVLPCLKNVPAYLLASYPYDLRDAEDVPAPYGSNLLDPNSYIDQAKAGFQFVARYGSTKVNTSLLSGVVTGILYPGDPHSVQRTVETGMNLIKYIECENERDKWWKGRKAYQTGFEYAANLSAFYDGNKNTMGIGVGVKNADPNIKVVIGGIASTSPDYVRAIIDWCKQYRGYNSDGSVNLCFDVMNYHCYADQSLTSPDGGTSRGASPEVSGVGYHADNFVLLAREFNVETWITETGYDLNQGSPLHVPPIANKTPEQVEGDWILRTSLLNARHGINRTFFYQMYDLLPSSGGLYASSGLLNDGQFNNGVFSRKVAADYLMQAQKLLGEYVYKETINSDPIVDRYELNGNSVYALVVPDEKNRTADYTLNLGSDSAKIYKLVPGSDTMAVQKVKLLNGKLQITVTETPVFVDGIGIATNVSSQSRTTNEAHTSAVSTDTSAALKTINSEKFDADGIAIKLYPNPATTSITLEIQNKIAKESQVQIFETGSGKLLKSFQLSISNYSSKTINVKDMPAGMYTLEILQGNKKLHKNFIKM